MKVDLEGLYDAVHYLVYLFQYMCIQATRSYFYEWYDVLYFTLLSHFLLCDI